MYPSFQIDFMRHQIWKIGCVNYACFPKSGHICSYILVYMCPQVFYYDGDHYQKTTCICARQCVICMWVIILNQYWWGWIELTAWIVFQINCKVVAIVYSALTPYLSLKAAITYTYWWLAYPNFSTCESDLHNYVAISFSFGEYLSPTYIYVTRADCTIW